MKVALHLSSVIFVGLILLVARPHGLTDSLVWCLLMTLLLAVNRAIGFFDDRRGS